MEPLAHLRRYRRRPAFQRMRTDPSTYLTTARLNLLHNLPSNHRLYARATRTGVLKNPDQLPPDIPRVPFTAEELEQIKQRRKHTPDPEDVRYQLQDSKLIQMWNADYEREEQWKEYDEARAAMEFKKEVAGLPDERFDKEEVVRERRRRVVSAELEDAAAVKKSVVEERFVIERDLEEGEIQEEADDVREIEEEEEEEVETKSLRSLKDANDRLKLANEAMRVVASGLQDNLLPASSEPENSEASGDESDDSTEAVCEFDLGDSGLREKGRLFREQRENGAWLEDFDKEYHGLVQELHDSDTESGRAEDEGSTGAEGPKARDAHELG